MFVVLIMPSWISSCQEINKILKTPLILTSEYFISISSSKFVIGSSISWKIKCFQLGKVVTVLDTRSASQIYFLG